MGIDIYMEWRGQNKREKGAQATGFSVTAGHVGYLREAYHGTPYATQELVKEAFESKTYKAQIPAKILRERLPDVLKIAAVRNQTLYNGENQKEVLEAFEDFVALAERKEQETDEAVTIYASF